MIACPHCRADNADDARFCGACGRAIAGTEPATSAGAARPSGAPDLAGREILGRYRVLAKLGEGGMGAVYRGEQISLKRKVAIKLLHPELSADPALVRRFNAEAELVARLSHPNTVNIFDFGQDADGTLFIAMEYLEGRSLRQVVAVDGPLPVRRALHIAQQIAGAIADAHHHGIVHRDLKPDNVMLTERGRDKDVVRVLDFGIAKLRDEQKQTINPMTQAGDLVGTPQYMAPEQIRGEAVDGRADVYALGAVIYEMVTGRLVFEGQSLMAILSRHLLDAPEPPTRRRPELALPPAIDALVLEMLEKDKARRLPSMDAAAERIAQLAASLGGAAVATAPGTWSSAPSPTPGPLPALSRPPGVPQTVPPGVMYTPPAATPPPAPATPVATPQPMPYAPPPRPHAPPPPERSLLWLWIILAVIAVGGVLGAIVFLTRDDARGAAQAGTGEIAGGGGEIAGGALAGDPVTIGGYRVVMPLGFIEVRDFEGVAGVDARAFTGTVDGHVATIAMFASDEDLSGASRDELDEGCDEIAATNFDGQMNASRLVTGKGAQRYRCTMAGSGQAIEGAVYSGASGTVLVFFAAEPGAFATLQPLREELFDRRVTSSSR